jgi:hypothetical protein
MDIRCPVSSSNSRAEKKKKKNQKKKKGSKSALHSGGMGVPKKGISEKGQNSGSRVANPAGGVPWGIQIFGGSMWQTHIGRNTPATTAYVGEVPLIRYLPIGKESAGSPVLN